MAYLRPDRRTQAPNEWGKPGVTYPHADPAYPQIVEETTVSKGTVLPAMLSSHPNTALYPGARLVSIMVDPGDNRSANRHLTYRTLPGPLIWKPGFDETLGTSTAEYHQEVAMGPAPSLPSVIGSPMTDPIGRAQTVYDTWIDPMGDSNVWGNRVTLCMATPPTRTEYESIGFEFPAIFRFIPPGWAIPTVAGFKMGGPFPGVNFELSAHRTLSTPAEVVISYSWGPPTVNEGIWTVTTPGIADRFFGIGPNTIHNSIFLLETESSGSQTVESLDASTPGSYTPGQTLTIRAEARLIKGTLWEKRVTTCAE